MLNSPTAKIMAVAGTTHRLLRICIVARLLASASCYSFGGPVSVCGDPYPHHHGVVSSKSYSPFNIVVSPTSYSPGDNITVSIVPRPDADPSARFKGFHIAAHPLQGKWSDLQGEFITRPPKTNLQYYFAHRANCLTHASNEERTNITVVWRAPSLSVGDLLISGTIMSDFETFWVNISALLTADQPYQPLTLARPLQIASPSHAKSEPQKLPLIEGCGTTKSCLLWPRTCSDPNTCDAVVAYSTAGAGFVRFQMAGLTPGYLSLGLSLDTKMDNDETLTCLVSPSGQLMFQRGFNPGYYNQRTTDDLVINVSMQYENGRLYCDFVRPAFAHVNMTLSRKTVLYPFDLSAAGKFYLYLGWGGLYPGSYDSLMVHEQLPVVAPYKMNLSNPSSYYFNSLPVEHQVHITFMLMAWLGLSSFAALVARYYRSSVLGTAKIDGEVAWLQIHRGMTFAAVPLTIAGFILPFVYLRSWSSSASVHAGFGVAVMALTVLQSTTALCRPRPTSRWRKAFGWFHRVIGLLAWACAATCMMLGVNIVYLPPLMITWGTAVVAVWIACQFIFGIALEVLQCVANPASSEAAIGNATVVEDEKIAAASKSSRRSSLGQYTKSVILVIYSLVIATLLAAGLSFTWAY